MIKTAASSGDSFLGIRNHSFLAVPTCCPGELGKRFRKTKNPLPVDPGKGHWSRYTTTLLYRPAGVASTPTTRLPRYSGLADDAHHGSDPGNAPVRQLPGIIALIRKHLLLEKTIRERCRQETMTFSGEAVLETGGFAQSPPRRESVINPFPEPARPVQAVCQHELL
jgi:hypothetical protein